MAGRRTLAVAAAQMGPVARDETRAQVVDRLVAMLHEAHGRGAQLVAFPELALTTFFPRWWFDDPAELAQWFERELPGPDTKVLYDEAARLGVGFCLGFAEEVVDEGADGEAVTHRYNTAVLVDSSGREALRYRKVHLPGHDTHEPHRPFQHLELGYFEPGPDGFGVAWCDGVAVGLALCNDRRWPETYRVLGLQGAEVVLIGYNTPFHYAPDPTQDHLAAHHNTLVMAAGAYQNALWVVGVAKGGDEEGVHSLADSQVIAPTGEVVARATSESDEVVVTVCDLDLGERYRRTVFDFARYRRPEHYGLITSRKAPQAPPPDGGPGAPVAGKAEP